MDESKGASETQAAKKKTDLSALNNVDVNIGIRSADVSYIDHQSAFETIISNFNMDLSNVGFAKDIQLKIDTDLNLSPSKDINTQGQIHIAGVTRIDWGKETFESVSTRLNVDLSDLKAKVSNLVNKQSGVPLKVELQAKAYPDSAMLEQLDFIVNDLRLSTTGEVKSFSPLAFDFKLNSNSMDLVAWRKIVIPLGQFGVKGKLSMNMDVKGAGSSYDYKGSLAMTDGGASLPGFKNPIIGLRTKLNIKNDRLQIENLAGLMGSSSFNINGSLANFERPRINVGIYSQNISATDFLPVSSNEEKQSMINQAKQSQPELTEAQIQQMVMGPIEQLKQIPILRKVKLNANLKVDKLYYDQMVLSAVVSEVAYSNLVLNLKKAQFDVFKGKAAAVANIDIRGSKPKYEVKAKVGGIDTEFATGVFVPDLKGSLTGRLNADFGLKGEGASKADLTNMLKGSGGFKLVNGTWSGLKAMEVIGKKLSNIKGAEAEAKKVRMGNRFKKFEGNFVVTGGKLNLKNFTMDLVEANTAVVGRGSVDFDLNLNMVASILAPFNNPPRTIRYRDGRAELPIEITGKAMAPNIGWEKMLRKVVGAYAEQKVKTEVKKKVDQEVQKLLKSKKAEDLMKKLGF